MNKDCGEVLISGESFCFHCGESVKENHRQTQLNKFVHDVKQQGKNFDEHTEFIFSDDVARELAPFVSGQLLGGSSKRPSIQPKQNDVPIQIVPKALTASPAEQEALTDGAREATPEHAADNILQGAAPFFRRDGDVLLAETKDYKGSNWAEQQRRFIILYAFAYEQLLNKPVPNKEHLKAVAEKANIIDKNNFTRYLSEEMKKYLIETSTGLAPNNDGKREVIRIVAELDDSQVPEGYAYWNKSQSEATKRSYLNDKDKERLQIWAKEDVDTGQLDSLLLKSGLDYALLAFWLLITHLKKGEKFRWNEAYEYLKARPMAVSASPETFSAAVKSKNNEDYFRESDDAYFLSPEANAKVEGWVVGTSKPGDPDKKMAS